MGETRAVPVQGRARWRRLLGVLLAFTLLLLFAVAVWLRGALYNRWVRFPKQSAALEQIARSREAILPLSTWREYRGVLHSHSELSHDCEVPVSEILRVLKETATDFICLSDHCVEGLADFGVQPRGLREGKLFIPGFEMKQGYMPFGVTSGVVLSNQMEPDVLARRVLAEGGLLFYAHPEEPRDWNRAELTGMEIYNIHADFKDEGGLGRLLPDLLVNQRQYPEQVFRLIFTPPAANLKRWDDLNRTRHLTGIAANDCHQNTGVRLVCTTNSTLRLEDTSPKTLREVRLTPWNRWLARLCFGPLTPGTTLLAIQLDPYERMARFVGTHVWAKDLTEEAILEALKAGRAFVGFDRLADSRGFGFVARTGSAQAVMGERTRWSKETRLLAAAPHAARFAVLKNGDRLHVQEGRSMEWAPPGPGLYRVEVELRVGDEWVPWIYANPIWLE
jgi:hypothetical protein